MSTATVKPVQTATLASPPSGRAGTDEQSRLKLQRALQDFEAIFLGYLLKSMRAGIPKNEKESDGYGGELMQGLFDMELARHMARSRSFGIGEMLYRQLTGEEMPKAVPSTPQTITMQRKAESAAAVKPESRREGSAMERRLAPFEAMIDEAARRHALDSSLIKAVIAAESGGRLDARSSKQAKGLMQLIDSTAAEMGVKNVWDARENISGGTKYLKQMLDRFGGDLRLALASYNAGPGAVEKHGGIPPFKETQHYVRRVMDYLRHFQQTDLIDDDED